MIDQSMIPEDEGSQLLFREVISVGPYDAALDLWVWEGIQTWSYVFTASAVSEVPDQALVALVKKAAEETLEAASPTIKRGDKTVFVNLVTEAQPIWPSFDPVDRRSLEEKQKSPAISH